MKKIQVIMMALIGWASTAGASTLIFSNTANVTSSYGNIILGKFDTSLGTLTGVTITINSTVAGSITVTNTSSTQQLSLDGYTSTFTLRQSASNNLGFTQISNSIIDGPVTSPDWTGAVLAAGTSQTFNLTSGVGGNNFYTDYNVVINASYFAAYESLGGLGTITFQAKDAQLLSLSGASYSADTTAAYAITGVSVTYTYTTVPEPGTTGLFLGGACALYLVRRANRKKA